jgi:hypothetical protein
MPLEIALEKTIWTGPPKHSTLGQAILVGSMRLTNTRSLPTRTITPLI